MESQQAQEQESPHRLLCIASPQTAYGSYPDLERGKRRLSVQLTGACSTERARSHNSQRAPGSRRRSTSASCRPCLRSQPARAAADRELTQHLFNRQQPSQMHQLQQPQLKVKSLLLPIPQLIKRPQHHLQKPRQLLFTEQRSRPSRAPLLIRRDLQQLARDAIRTCAIHSNARNLRNHAVPQIPHKLPRQLRRTSFPHPAAGSPP